MRKSKISVRNYPHFMHNACYNSTISNPIRDLEQNKKKGKGPTRRTRRVNKLKERT